MTAGEVDIPVEKPVIELIPYQRKSLGELGLRLELDRQAVRRQLETALRNHFRCFGTRPFDLYFDPIIDDFVIRPNSVIGLVQADAFVLKLLPAIDDLDLGKCIGMAQYCGYSVFSHENKRLLRRRLSDEQSYKTLDFFALSLFSNVSTILANGLRQKFSEEYREATKLGGNVNIERSLDRGKIRYRPIVGDIAADFDVLANRIIKTALLIAKENSRSRHIVRVASALLDSFRTVTPLSCDEMENLTVESDSSIPREDYRMALIFSELIIKGLDFGDGSVDSFLPLFTLDMDKLFEKYVSTALSESLKQDAYRVLTQKRLRHNISPDNVSKEYVPDLIICYKNDPGPIVLDTKNKYSDVLRDERYIANNDLFQITYYCHSLKTKIAFLVYPGNRADMTIFPRPGSESKTEYARKRQEAITRIEDTNKITVFNDDDNVKIAIYKWIIDLSGTQSDTMNSIKSLALFIDSIMRERNESP